MAKLFQVRRTPTTISLTERGISSTGSLPAGFTSLTSIRSGKSTLVFAFDKTTCLLDAYRFRPAGDPFQAVYTGSTALNLQPWDMMRSFVLGNVHYLMTYHSDSGYFGFYEVKSNGTLSKPYTFMNKRDWKTQNFTEVTPFVSLGLVYVLGYDRTQGTVAIFSLDVINFSENGTPPLNMLNVWYHHWAINWTNFAFFELAQSNFFFKINIGPDHASPPQNIAHNVNIDHIQDTPANGTVEIGSWMQDDMPNAKDVTMAAMVPWVNGVPILTTYDDVAKVVKAFEIHTDCKGFYDRSTTQVGNASIMVSFRAGNRSWLLLY